MYLLSLHSLPVSDLYPVSLCQKWGAAMPFFSTRLSIPNYFLHAPHPSNLQRPINIHGQCAYRHQMPHWCMWSKMDCWLLFPSHLPQTLYQAGWLSFQDTWNNYDYHLNYSTYQPIPSNGQTPSPALPLPTSSNPFQVNDVLDTCRNPWYATHLHPDHWGDSWTTGESMSVRPSRSKTQGQCSESKEKHPTV